MDNEINAANDAKTQEYIGSVVRMVDFIDNFTGFMYHNIEIAIKNSPQDFDNSNVYLFLTSLRKEIADFQSEVNSLRNMLDV